MLGLTRSTAKNGSPWLTRRSFLQVGTLGVAGLTLPNLLRARAQAVETGQHLKDTAVVWLFLSGGPSHIDTYDPKPDAPDEIRGPYRPLRTNVPGVLLSELLPQQARLMDKMALVRTFSHGDGNHGSAVHWVATGVLHPPADRGEPAIAPHPGAVAARIRGSHPLTGMPPYIALSRLPTSDGPAYLGIGCAPMEATGAGRDNLQLPAGFDLSRVQDRRRLRHAFDNLRRDMDRSGAMRDMDDFERQAFQLILGQQAREAFDLGLENARTVNRYGPGLGAQLLTARRLCEAGAAFVSIEYSGDGRRYGWDNHSRIFEFLPRNVPALDHAVAAFVEDVSQRGLDQRILLVVCGEMGRTPRINERAGRDHWPQVMFVLLAGGGLRMNQVIGQSSGGGEVAQTRAFGARDLLATLYHVLGIDPRQQFNDLTGRPLALLADGAPIAELV